MSCRSVEDRSKPKFKELNPPNSTPAIICIENFDGLATNGPQELLCHDQSSNMFCPLFELSDCYSQNSPNNQPNQFMQPSTSEQALNYMKNEENLVDHDVKISLSSEFKHSKPFVFDQDRKIGSVPTIRNQINNNPFVNNSSAIQNTNIFNQLFETFTRRTNSMPPDSRANQIAREKMPYLMKDNIELWKKSFLRYCLNKNISNSSEQLEEAYLSLNDTDRNEIGFIYNLAKDSCDPFRVFCERLMAKYEKSKEEIYEEITRMKLKQFPSPDALFQKLFMLTTSVNMCEEIALAFFYGKFSSNIAREIKVAHRNQPIERLGVIANEIYFSSKKDNSSSNDSSVSNSSSFNPQKIRYRRNFRRQHGSNVIHFSNSRNDRDRSLRR